MSRAIVLLGAGASVPAGLPTSAVLTRETARWLASRRNSTAEAAAFQSIVSELQAAGRPTDIESVYATAELMLEFAARAPASSVWGPAPAALRALVGIQPDLRVPTPVDEADPGLIRLAVISQLKSLGRVSYLDPIFDLVDSEGLDVATLNYDLSFEAASRARGGAYRIWYPARSVVCASAVRLWKLHGSLDWTWRTEAPSNPGAPPRWVVDRPSSGRDRAIVFGAGNKLTPHGPFLELLAAWEQALSRADHLLIVGYGFADHHINETLTRWMWAAPGQRTVTVVAWQGRSSTDPPYLRQLRSWLNGDTAAGGPFVPPDGHRRLVTIRTGADAGLPRAVSHVRRLAAQAAPVASDPRPDRFIGRVGAQTICNDFDSRRP